MKKSFITSRPGYIYKIFTGAIEKRIGATVKPVLSSHSKIDLTKDRW